MWHLIILDSFKTRLLCLQQAISNIKNGQQQSAKNLYQDYLTKATRALTDAEKDNNFIYHEAVPDAKNLNAIAKAPVAKPTPLPSRLSSNFQGILLPITMKCLLNLLFIHFVSVRFIPRSDASCYSPSLSCIWCAKNGFDEYGGEQITRIDSVTK